MDMIALALLIVALAVFFAIWAYKPRAVQTLKEPPIRMPGYEVFEIFSHKNYTRAREIEATAKAKDAANTSIEHLDYLSSRFARIGEGKE
jgi:hypothetical protein